VLATLLVLGPVGLSGDELVRAVVLLVGAPLLEAVTAFM